MMVHIFSDTRISQRDRDKSTTTLFIHKYLKGIKQSTLIIVLILNIRIIFFEYKSWNHLWYTMDILKYLSCVNEMLWLHENNTIRNLTHILKNFSNMQSFFPFT